MVDGEISQQQAVDSLTRTREHIETAKGLGADVDSATESFKNAKPAIDAQDFSRAVEWSKKAQKEAVMAALQSTWSSILAAKDDGKDIETAKEAFTRARTIVKTEDFDAAFKDMNEAIKLCDSAAVPEKAEEVSQESEAEKYQAATELLQDTWSVIKEAKEQGRNTDKPEELFKKARDVIKTKDYSNAVELCNQARRYLSSPKDQIKDEAEGLFNKLSKEISEIIEYGMGSGAERLLIREIEAFVQDAENGIKAKNYKNALGTLQRAQESMTQLEDTYIANAIPSMILAAEAAMREAKEEGLDVSYQEGLLAQTNKAHEAKEYIDARNLSNKITTSIESARAQQAIMSISEELSPLKRTLTEAKDLGLNIRKLERNVKGVEENLESKNIDGAKDQLDKAKVQAEKLANQLDEAKSSQLAEQAEALYKELEGADKLNDELKSIYVELEAAKEKDDKAKMVEHAKAFRSKAESAEKAIELDKVSKKFDELKAKAEGVELLEEDSKLLAEKFAKGNSAKEINDIKSIERYIGEIGTIIEEGPAKFQARNDEDRAKTDGLIADLEAYNKMGEVGRELGLGSSLIDQSMEASGQAKELIEGGDQTQLEARVMKVKELMEQAAIEHLNTTRQSVLDAKQNGVNTTEAEEVFTKAQDHLRNSAHDEVFKVVKEVQEKIANAQAAPTVDPEEVSQKIADLRIRSEALQQKGQDITAVDASLTQAERDLNENPNSAQSLVVDAEIKTGELETKVKTTEVIEALSGHKERMAALKENGADTSEVEEVFKQAEPAMQSHDFDKAMEVAHEVGNLLDAIDEAMTKGPMEPAAPSQSMQDEALAKINLASQEIHSWKSAGWDISEGEGYMQQAMDSFKSGEFSWARDYAQQVLTYLQKLTDEYNKQNEEPAAEEPAPAEPEPAPAEPAPEPGMDQATVVEKLKEVKLRLVEEAKTGHDISHIELEFKKAEPAIRSGDLEGTYKIATDVLAMCDALHAEGAAEPAPEPAPAEPEPEPAPAEPEPAPAEGEPEPAPAEPAPAEPEPAPAEAEAGEEVDQNKVVCDEAIASLFEVLDDFKKLDMNTSALEQCIENAKAQTDGGQYEQALETVNNGVKEVEQLEFMVPLYESMNALDTTIAEAKELGADMARAEEVQAEAKAALEAGDGPRANDLLSRAKDLAQSALDIAKALQESKPEEGGEQPAAEPAPAEPEPVAEEPVPEASDAAEEEVPEDATVIGCPECGHHIVVTDKTRPIVVTCSKCGASGTLNE